MSERVRSDLANAAMIAYFGGMILVGIAAAVACQTLPAGWVFLAGGGAWSVLSLLYVIARGVAGK